MRTLIYGYDAAIAAWVADKLPDINGAEDFGAYTALGVLRGNRVIAGVVYYDYRKTDMMLAVAASSPRWLGRNVLRAIFEYPFDQLGCQRVSAVIDRKNKRARKLVEGIGFRLEGVLRKALKHNRDAILYGMVKDECRWIQSERNDNGKEKWAISA